jgi:hypothetical protein
MSETTNHRVRFAENNIALEEYLIDYSSENSTYPIENLLNDNRSLKWRSNFNFTIDDSNKNIFINDGSNVTVDLTPGKYSATSLASHIQTRLNVLSSGWSCSYSSTTYRFTIARGSSATLRLSQTTSSTWNILGYLTNVDIVGTSFPAHAARIHSEEYLEFDFQIQRPVDFIAMICPINEIFGLSQDAEITVEFANLPNAWSAPALSVTVPVKTKGAFKFIDGDDSAFRYARVVIRDRENNSGYIELSHLYLGDYVTIDNSNINNGFEIVEEDLSSSSPSDSGKRYFDEGLKYTTFNNTALGVFDIDSKDKIFRMWEKLGLTKSFYVSLDPRVLCSTEIDDLTKFMQFNSKPNFRHVIYDKWTCSFTLREVI